MCETLMFPSSKQLQIWLGKKIAVGLFQKSIFFSLQKKKFVFIADVSMQ